MRSRLVGFTVALALIVLSEGVGVKCFNCEVPVWGFGDATCESWVDTWTGLAAGGECPTCACNKYSDDAEWNAEQDLRDQSCSNACQFAGSGGYGNGCDFAGPYDGNGYPSGSHLIDATYMQDPIEWPVTYTMVFAEVEGYCDCTSNDEGPAPMSVRVPRVPLSPTTPAPIIEKPAPTPKLSPWLRPKTAAAPRKPTRIPITSAPARDPKRIGG